MGCEISKARRPPRPYLTVGLEALYHHLPLGLVLPEVPEESLLLGIILANPLQAALDPTLHVPLVECQPKVEGIGPSPITGPQVSVSDESTAGISSGGSGRAKW
jgi:hypothetical protein